MSYTPKKISNNTSSKSDMKRIRTVVLTDLIGEIKTVLIQKGVKTEQELSSQECILFAVVEWLTTKNIRPDFPRQCFDGIYDIKEKNKLQERFRRRKAAYDTLKEFIFEGGVGKWEKTRKKIENIEVLKKILEHIRWKEPGSNITVSQTFPSPLLDSLIKSKMSSTPKIPYGETRKSDVEKVRHMVLKDLIGEMKNILIQKGFKTEQELSSQECTLFAVVEWLTTKNLHADFPRQSYEGIKDSKERSKLQEQVRRRKQQVAYSELKNFIFEGGVGKWEKTTKKIENIEVLKKILDHIRWKSLESNVTVSPPPAPSPLSMASILADTPSPSLPFVTPTSTNSPVLGQTRVAMPQLYPIRFFQPMAPLVPRFTFEQCMMAFQNAVLMNTLDQMKNQGENKENKKMKEEVVNADDGASILKKVKADALDD